MIVTYSNENNNFLKNESPTLFTRPLFYEKKKIRLASCLLVNTRRTFTQSVSMHLYFCKNENTVLCLTRSNKNLETYNYATRNDFL